jgi:hypothetical protein
MALPLTDSQSQTATQSPQGASSAVIGGAPTSSVQPTSNTSVQPSTATILQNSAGNLKIQLPPPSPASKTVTTTAPPKQHHTNPVFFGLAIGLFVVAVLLFWLAGRAERSKSYK